MKYRIQHGVVLETICGVPILISTVEARKTCPYLTQLNDSSVFIWKMLKEGNNTEEMSKEIVKEYHISDTEAEEALMLFLHGMAEQGFILEEES